MSRFEFCLRELARLVVIGGVIALFVGMVWK